MKTQYLVRFDDICPTMNWSMWERVETLLNQYQVKPLLAVIPDCQDPNLAHSEARSDFWNRVREWERQGWTIAMHGYQHSYVTQEAGVLGIQKASEFVGISDQEQIEKIQKSMAIFKQQQVDPQFFVAPSHSFDQSTVKALLQVGINTISDGFGFYPYVDRTSGMLYLPQQMWRFRSMPPGIWTVCLHHNTWGEAELAAFAKDLEKYSEKCADFAEVRRKYLGREQNFLDFLGAQSLRWVFRWKRSLQQTFKQI